jgi:molybdopterin molybdotransferase
MHSISEALAVLAEAPLAATAVVQIPVAASMGRVLAEPLLARRDQPAFDRATMDGYALLPGQGVGPYRVRGAQRPGQPAAAVPGLGECLWITTGAAVPAGCTVVPVEASDGARKPSDGGDAEIRIPDTGATSGICNVARRGEDAAAGQLLLPAGRLLTPLLTAAAAMAGAATVAVRAAPRIAILTTGDELEAGGETGIADSNGPLLAALLASFGISATRQRCDDDAAGTARTVAELLHTHDLLITTGGVSAGDRDHIPAAARAAGLTTRLHGVAMQPGKPVFFADDGWRALLGLPGNPVSVVATAHCFLPTLLGLCWPGFAWQWQELPIHGWLPRLKAGRTLLLPARLHGGAVQALRWNGSGDLFAAAAGDGFVELDPKHPPTAGALVRFLPYIGGRGGQGLTLPRVLA